MLKRKIRKIAAIALAAVMLVSFAVPGFAATTDPNPGTLETKNAALSKQAAVEGMVLLDNNGALPMAASGNVALFGVGAYATVKGGTGSGDVNNRYSVSARQGFEAAGYNVTTSDEYYDAMTYAYDNLPGSGGMWSSKDYAAAEVPLTASSIQPKAATDTAVYIIARNSGEGSDRSTRKGDYYLHDNERANIKMLGQTYANVVVVINAGGIIDTSFFKEINAETKDPNNNDALDALFLLSQAGQEGGHALVEVLNGTVNPSGKLTDSWAASYDYYPASDTIAEHDGDSMQENYTEGLYVGYRYFDSFYKSLAADPDSVVNYPFGFGLSYTDFEIQVESVTADMNNVTVQATVTNTGDTYYGKEVVEVYFSAPQTGLDKPYQELAGFGKTDLLAPGECQTLTISFPTTEMSSYDEGQAAYIMDAGDYIIRVGNSSRNTQVGGVITLNDTTLTEQLSNQANDERLDDEWTSDPANFYSYDAEAEEIEAAAKITLDTTGFVAPNNASTYAQDVPVDESSYYYSIDRDLISSIKAYLPEGVNVDNWENTGAAYPAKTGETVEYIPVTTSATLYDVYKGTVSMEDFVAGLSVTELANIVEGARNVTSSTLSARGAAGYTTPLYEDKGIPAMVLADGPAGVRITREWTANSETYYQFCTAWPIATMLAQTWNMDLVEEVGKAIGEEMGEYGVTLWLAPSLNLHRDPMCGRNFEYYSEDPYISGMFTIATTKGVQATPGVGVTIKHYAGNNQETNRSSQNDTINERALREMYLKGFEMTVKSTQPMAVMSSYNKISGTYVAGDYDILFDILRGEWGFKGLVMTDWGGVRAGIVNCMYAGNDLIEPGGAPQDVINATLPTDATIDIGGLPVYTWQSYGEGGGTSITYSWSMGNVVLNPNAEVVASTTVDATTDLTQQPRSGELSGRQTIRIDPFLTVDNAYNHAVSIINNPDVKFTDAQKDAFVFSDVQRDADNKVTSYTLSIKGEYIPTMRLGDLQRSARLILNIAMQSAQFAELAELQGVSGISVAPYSEQFTGTLVDYTTVAKAPVNLRSKVDLGKALAKAEDIFANENKDDYTTSWETLEGFYTTAKAVYDNPSSTNAQYQVMYELLDTYLEALTKRIDNSKLVARLAELRASYTENQFTPASWGVFAQALADADDVVANRNATANDINMSMLDLALALNQLERVANKDALAYAIAQAEDMLANNVFTPGSTAAIQQAINDAKTVMDKTDATQAEVDAALGDLMAAVEARIDPADKAWLAYVIGVADQLTQGQYTPNSWNNFTDVLAKAKAVYNDTEAHQETVDEAATMLLDAINGLQLRANTAALESAIAEAKKILNNSDKYVASTIKNLPTEVTKAEQLLANDNATEEQIKAQTKALLDRCMETRLKADKTKLRSLVGRARTFSLDMFTPASAQAFSAQLDNAVKVMDDPEVTQETVDTTSDNLAKAMNNLQPKAETENNNGDNGNTENAAPVNNGSGGITRRIGGGTAVPAITPANPDAPRTMPEDEANEEDATTSENANAEDEDTPAPEAANVQGNNTTPLAQPAQDSNMMYLWISLAALLVLAAGAAGYILWKRKKNQSQQKAEDTTKT